MKFTYWLQIIISCIIILRTNVASTVLQHWAYRSFGFVICGMLWLIHPVLPKSAESSKRTLLWVRLAGIILILIGIFSRSYNY